MNSSGSSRAKAFETLGLEPEVSASEIEVAYRKARRKAHPDHGGTSQEFIAIQRAYKLLTNTSSQRCAECDGSGFVETRYGAFVESNPCPTCWKLRGNK